MSAAHDLVAHRAVDQHTRARRAMTTDGSVSVVMPFLNAVRFIREAIESVLAQTYTEWELILVDDGSSDGSPAIANEYAERDPARVVYVSQPDRRTHGQSVSRNLGLARATGAYIAFLDADDVWLPRKLEQQVAILRMFPQVGMVYGASQWWYSWSPSGGADQRDYVQRPAVPTDTPLAPPSLVWPYFVSQEATIPNPSSVVVRRSLVEQVGGFEDVVAYENVVAYEDQAFYAKVIVHAPVVASDQCWDRYRQHADSATAMVERRGGAESARAAFLGWLVDYLAEHAVDGELRRALRRQQFRYAHPLLNRIARAVRLRA